MSPKRIVHNSHSSFLRRSFFARALTRANEVERANILAPGLRPRKLSRHTFFPPSPPNAFGDWPLGSRIQLQQRNCSRFTRDFLHRSTDQTRKELTSDGGTRSACHAEASRRRVVSNHSKALTAQRPPFQVAACASAFKIYLINRTQLYPRACI